jgi:hypothetical protein
VSVCLPSSGPTEYKVLWCPVARSPYWGPGTSAVCHCWPSLYLASSSPFPLRDFPPWDGPPPPCPCALFRFSRCVSLLVENNDDTNLSIPGGQRNRDSRQLEKTEEVMIGSASGLPFLSIHQPALPCLELLIETLNTVSMRNVTLMAPGTQRESLS